MMTQSFGFFYKIIEAGWKNSVLNSVITSTAHAVGEKYSSKTLTLLTSFTKDINGYNSILQ